MSEKITRRLSAIMFADIVGYTAMMQQDEMAGFANVKRYRKELARLVDQYGGEILQHYGDGSLVTFTSAVEGMRCAHDLQLSLQSQITDEGTIPGVPLRLGLHIGDIIIEGSDIYGNGVNIASRVESLGQPGTILFSHSIYEKIHNLPEFKVTPLGAYHFKNVKERMKIYALSNAPLVVPDPKTITGKLEPKKSSRTRGWMIGLGMLALITGFLWYQFIYLPANQRINSIAVLPFDDRTDDTTKQVYMSGLHEALISELGQIKSLRVISKTSMQRFRATELTIQEIAKQLKVDAIVETSVFQVDSLIRLKANLIQAFPEEEQLWSNVFSRDFTHVLEVYRAITRSIVDEIKLTILPEEVEQLNQSELVNPEAYKAYLTARSYWGSLSREGFQKALEYYQVSIEKDPEYAPGYGGVASVWVGRQQMGMASREEAVPLIKSNLEKAFQLDNHLAESYYYSALVEVWTDWDWESAEIAFQNALEINPNFAEVHAYYSHFLMIQQRPVEMNLHMERALDLDPYNPLFLVLQGVEFIFTGRNQEAIQSLANLEKLAPNNVLIKSTLWMAHHNLENQEEAFQKWKEFLQLVSDSSVTNTFEETYHAYGYETAMEKAADQWAAQANEKFVPPDNVLWMYAVAGQRDKALEWLEICHQTHDSHVPYFGVNAMLQSLHNEPQFRDVLERLNLPLQERFKN